MYPFPLVYTLPHTNGMPLHEPLADLNLLHYCYYWTLLLLLGRLSLSMLKPEILEEMYIKFAVFVRKMLYYIVTLHLKSMKCLIFFLNPMLNPSVPLGASFDI